MNLIEQLEQNLAGLDAQALRRRRFVAESACAPHQTLVAPSAPDIQRTPLAFCSNDYLGLAAHPALADALAEGAQRYGAGSGGSHLIGGHSRAHALLEVRLAAWYAPYIPDVGTLFYSTGYMANIGVLTSLGSSDAVIFADKLNHASLIDGGRLAEARVERYPHCDTANLAMRLERCDAPIKLIVTDSVFSMDGDIAPMHELLALAERHDAWLIVDDAHGFGTLGQHGRGIVEHADLHSERLIYIGTFGKGAGLSGAFVAAHRTIAEWLLQRSRTYIFTTATPPAVAHALLTSLELLESSEGDTRRTTLDAHIAHLQRALPAGLATLPDSPLRLGVSQTAVQPVIIGDNAAAMELAARLDEAGLRVPAIRPPTVPVGTARLRISLSAAHTTSDVERLIAALIQYAPRRAAA